MFDGSCGFWCIATYKLKGLGHFLAIRVNRAFYRARLIPAFCNFEQVGSVFLCGRVGFTGIFWLIMVLLGCIMWEKAGPGEPLFLSLRKSGLVFLCAGDGRGWQQKKFEKNFIFLLTSCTNVRYYNCTFVKGELLW